MNELKIRLDGHTQLHGLCLTGTVVKLTEAEVTVQVMSGTTYTFTRAEGVPVRKSRGCFLQVRLEDLRAL